VTRSSTWLTLAGTLCIAALPLGQALAQTVPSWTTKEEFDAAKAEGGGVVVYGSMNESEALPLYKLFEDQTGIKVSYIRSSDTGLLARIAIERKAGNKSWDIVCTTAVNRLPAEFLAPVDLAQAKFLPEIARATDKRWYGVYANYNTPAYNTKFVKKEDLPKTYEEFAQKKEWAGHIAIDNTDGQWVAAMFKRFGDTKAKQILADMAKNLNPVLTDGHLALARSVGAGEYWIALNNYTNLTVNVTMNSGATDYWALDPVSVFYGQVGVSATAPHPKSALLIANFMLSVDGQKQLTTAGRIPARNDVAPNPPDTVTRFGSSQIVFSQLSAAEDKSWQKVFTDIFKAKR
jgi:iron(III) transport system substrate-binding protein